MSEIFKPSREEAKKHLVNFFELLSEEKSIKKKSDYITMIGAINEFLNENQLKILLSFQNSKHISLRESLIHSILGLKTKEIVAVCINLGNDENEEVRYYALFNLVNHVRKESLEMSNYYRNKLKDKSKRIQDCALNGLAQNKYKMASEIK